jgi:hypothetical protein
MKSCLKDAQEHGGSIGPLFNMIAHKNQKLSCFEVQQQNFKKSKSLFGAKSIN